MKFYYFLFLIIILNLFGCGNLLEGNTNLVVIKPKRVEKLLASNITDSISYIQLEAKGRNYLSDITDIIIRGDTIYIVDALEMKVEVFSKTGNYLFGINSVGKGPGEYTEISDIYIDDYIYLLSRRLKKIIRFDYEGNVLDERRIDFYIGGIAHLENDKFLTFGRSSGRLIEGGRQAGLGIIDFAHEKPELQTLRSFGGSYAADNMVQKNYFTKGVSGEILLLNATDTIFAFQKNNISAKYILDFGQHHIPAHHRKLSNSPENSEFLKRQNYVTYKDNLIEVRNHVFFGFLTGENPNLNSVYFDKKNKECKYSSNIHNDISPMPYQFPSFKWDDNKVISVIDIDLIRQYKELYEREKAKLVEIKGEQFYDSLMHKFSDYIQNDRPVLAVAHL